MNITSAQKMYFTVPVENRCSSLDDLVSRATFEAERSVDYATTANKLRYLTGDGDNIILSIDGNVHPVGYTAFSQLARMHDVGPNMLRKLRPETATQVLNETLADNLGEAPMRILAGSDGAVRGVNTGSYLRRYTAPIAVPIRDFADDLGLITPSGWAIPGDDRARVATDADCGPWTLVRPGQMISPAGIYYTPHLPHDTFVLLMDTRNPIVYPDGDVGYRVVVIRHSESGHGAYTVLQCVVKATCGNHNFLGARDVKVKRAIHRGAGNVFDASVSQALDSARLALESAPWEQERLNRAASYLLAGSQDEATARAASLTGLGRKWINNAISARAMSSTGDYGDPLSAYSYASYITQASQALPSAAERFETDFAASALFDVAA